MNLLSYLYTIMKLFREIFDQLPHFFFNFHVVCYISSLVTCRELQAKAKRLARFKVELSQTVQSTSGIGNQKVSVKSHDQSFTERRKSIGERSTDMVADFPNGNVLSDYEGPESSTIITGLCPDMCPGSCLSFLIEV